MSTGTIFHLSSEFQIQLNKKTFAHDHGQSFVKTYLQKLNSLNFGLKMTLLVLYIIFEKLSSSIFGKITLE